MQLLHVRVAADPAQDPPLVVADGHRTRLEPAVRPIVFAESELGVEDARARRRLRPTTVRHRAIVGVNLLEPTVAELLCLGPPRVLEPLGAQVVAASVRKAGPDEVGHRLDEALDVERDGERATSLEEPERPRTQRGIVGVIADEARRGRRDEVLVGHETNDELSGFVGHEPCAGLGLEASDVHTRAERRAREEDVRPLRVQHEHAIRGLEREARECRFALQPTPHTVRELLFERRAVVHPPDVSRTSPSSRAFPSRVPSTGHRGGGRGWPERHDEARTAPLA